MKTCRSCQTCKPLTEYYPAKGYKDGHHNICKCCEAAYQKARSQLPDVKKRAAEKSRAWRLKNPEKSKEVSRNAARKRRLENPDLLRKAERLRTRDKAKRRIVCQRYYENNKSAINERIKKYAALNPHSQTTRKATRRAKEFNAKVSWANDFFIKEAYHLAKLREIATGMKWHVDHIVPLNSKIVCGLHVEHNLQVIPAYQNLSKSNLFWPDMPPI